ncbi:YncE family protein [Geobacter sp.]|uniref:YncE family protein n=1 Tax=Geobacter sp. TaxID=46610 RepID=UPI002626732A|nr:YncE family protein [Geobacter sp.]
MNTNTRLQSIPIGFDGAAAVLFDGKYLWVANNGNGICKIDPSTDSIVFSSTSIMGAPSVNGIGFDGTHIWLPDFNNNVLNKIDPETNTVVATIPAGNGARGIAFDGTYIWLANSYDATIMRIDITTNAIVETIQLPAGTRPYNFVFDGTHMWVADQISGGGRVFKILVRGN